MCWQFLTVIFKGSYDHYHVIDHLTAVNHGQEYMIRRSYSWPNETTTRLKCEQEPNVDLNTNKHDFIFAILKNAKIYIFIKIN